MMTPTEFIHWAFDTFEVGALLMLLRDVLSLRARIDEIEIIDDDFLIEEHKLESQDDQLRQELDNLHAAVDFLRKARRSKTVPFSSRQTLEGPFAPPLQENATRVFNPNEPKLPTWCVACQYRKCECRCEA